MTTNDKPTSQSFTVCMHPKLEQDLRDTAIFPEFDLDNLYHELPRLHPMENNSRQRKHRLPKQTRVFRGQFDRSNSGFTYLQIGDRLHVVEFWLDGKFLSKRGRPKVDVVIGRVQTVRRSV